MQKAKILRRPCRLIKVGAVEVGGGAPISVQSMTNTDSEDGPATFRQINDLAAAGADMVRVSTPTQAAVEVFARLVKTAPVPLIADVHFDYKIALAALSAGAACLRINPGNIGRRDPNRGSFSLGQRPRSTDKGRGQRRVFGKGFAGEVRRANGKGLSRVSYAPS